MGKGTGQSDGFYLGMRLLENKYETGTEHLRRKRKAENVVFGNSLLHLRADLNRRHSRVLAPSRGCGCPIWRSVYSKTFLSSAQSMRSSLLNRGVKKYTCDPKYWGWYKIAATLCMKME